MVNRYPVKCKYCGEMVPAGAGKVWKSVRRWIGAHLACEKDGEPRVIATRFNSGAVVYRNSRGRCEDAPCCGCCS